MCLFQRRRESLSGCAFRHDTVSRHYDVYYSWQFSQMADAAPGTRRSSPRSPRQRRRFRRRRRWYLGVDRHGIVRTFRVTSAQRRRARHSGGDDVDGGEEPEFQLPRRVLFFQRWIAGARLPASASNFPAGRVSIVPPGWTSPSPRPTDAGVSADWDRRRKLRRQRRRRRCSRLMKECRGRRRRGRIPTLTTSTTDAAAVLRDS